jgi:hypothetical protein
MEGNFTDPLRVVKRDYVRTSYWSVEAKFSKDNRTWFDADVPNIAAGGVLLLTSRPLYKGDTIWIKLTIDPILGPSMAIRVSAKALIVADRGVQDEMNAFAASFTEISQSDQIRLDELVRLTIAKNPDACFIMEE